MDTGTVSTADPKCERSEDCAEQIASLRAQVAAEEHALVVLDEALNFIYEHRGKRMASLHDKRSALRTLEHYTALASEARAVRA